MNKAFTSKIRKRYGIQAASEESKREQRVRYCEYNNSQDENINSDQSVYNNLSLYWNLILSHSIILFDNQEHSKAKML